MADDYNGWENRETWAAALHIGNDHGLYLHFQDRAADLLDATDGDRPAAAWRLAEAIADYLSDVRDRVIEGAATRDERSMLADVGSLWRVNHDAVAAHILDA